MLSSWRIPINPTTNTSHALVTRIPLYVAGEKYDVAALKTLAKEKYESEISVQWNAASFAAGLKLLYEGTPDNDRPTRDIAI
jgi:hypothetical protein